MATNIKFVLVFMGILGFIACNNAPKNANSVETKTEITPKWFFKTQTDSMENPRTQIFVVLKDTVKVSDGTANFRELGKEEYADKKIPKEAVSACYGFWAGLEQQYILIDSSNTWVVKRKMIDSESPDGHLETFEKMIEVKK